MRKLEINWIELDAAFQGGSWDMRFYLDLETGDVVMVTNEIARYLKEPPDYDLPDWMQHDLQMARQVEERDGTRYIRIPQKDRCTSEWMVEWLESEGVEPTNPIELPPEPEPEPEEEPSRDALIEELTLLLIYLCSWEERPLPDLTVHRDWKGHLFEVLDVLEEKGYIAQTRRAKSLALTEEGVLRAQGIEERYTS